MFTFISFSSDGQNQDTISYILTSPWIGNEFHHIIKCEINNTFTLIHVKIKTNCPKNIFSMNCCYCCVFVFFLWIQNIIMVHVIHSVYHFCRLYFFKTCAVYFNEFTTHKWKQCKKYIFRKFFGQTNIVRCCSSLKKKNRSNHNRVCTFFFFRTTKLKFCWCAI